GKERSDAVRAPRSAATRGEGDTETERSDSRSGDRRGVGYADHRTRFRRAQRGWKRRAVPPPLMPFSFLPRVLSFSEESRSYLLMYQRKLMVPPHLVPPPIP